LVEADDENVLCAWRMGGGGGLSATTAMRGSTARGQKTNETGDEKICQRAKKKFACHFHKSGNSKPLNQKKFGRETKFTKTRKIFATVGGQVR
jgi:hypothetical protein